jgi:uncharacterized membrane protein YvbJ
MVYCVKCGTKNVEDASYCSDCGVNLETGSFEKTFRSGKVRKEDECFGLPNSGAIAGIVFGIMIVFWGLSIFLGWRFNIMAFMIIIFGTLLASGAIYKLRKK